MKLKRRLSAPNTHFGILYSSQRTPRKGAERILPRFMPLVFFSIFGDETCSFTSFAAPTFNFREVSMGSSVRDTIKDDSRAKVTVRA